MAQSDHHTSRESDPQLHTHSFIFNLAPRRDGSWGAILSRELYTSAKGRTIPRNADRRAKLSAFATQGKPLFRAYARGGMLRRCLVFA
jgi:conjugative relaxase-like TrwC/TraI family protein